MSERTNERTNADDDMTTCSLVLRASWKISYKLSSTSSSSSSSSSFVIVRSSSSSSSFGFVSLQQASKRPRSKRPRSERPRSERPRSRQAERPRSRDVCVLCVCRVRHGLYAANDSLAGCMWQRSIRGRTRARARNHAVYMQCTLLCD